MSVLDFENRRWEHPQSLEFRHAAARVLVDGKRVLDVGCGDGALMVLLREDGREVAGADLSATAVAHAREKGFTVAQLPDDESPLPFPDGSFECVVALDVLEHVYDPARLLGELVRVSSGSLVLGVPNFSSLPARLQTLIGQVPENNRPNKGHVYWFNWPTFMQLAAGQGLALAALRVNAPGERTVAGPMMRFLAYRLPNLFALSYVARFTVSSDA